MRNGSPLYSPIPLIRLGKSLRSGTPSGRFLLSNCVYSFDRINSCDIIELSMAPEEPSATWNVSGNEQ